MGSKGLIKIEKKLKMKSFFQLMISAGIPKIPFFGLPLIVPFILVGYGGAYSVLRSKFILSYFVLVFLFSMTMLIRCISSTSSIAEIYFIISLTIKFIIGPFIGFYVAKAVRDDVLKYYLPVQLLFLTASLLSASVYDILLLFQTNAAAMVFSEIKNLRGVGFGLLHNEGAVFVSIFLLLQYYRRGKKASVFDFLAYGFAAMSRLTAVFLIFIQLIIYPFRFLMFLGIIFVVTYIFQDSFSDIINQVLEPVIFFLKNGEFFMASVQHLGTMITLPDNQLTWIFGDGLFFSSGGFYKGTDLGYLRLIFFGGLFVLILYFAVHFYILLAIRTIPLGLTALFILMFITANIKGLNPHTWMFFSLYYIDKFRCLR